jgi:hypothetical protein
LIYIILCLPLIIGTSNRLEGLLACSVPYLNFNVKVVDLENLRAKLYSQCWLMLQLVASFGEAQ